MRVKLKKIVGGSADGRIFKGIMTLLLGSVSARAIGLICMPILTRVYSPEDYGVLAVFAAFTTIMATILGLRFSQAVPLPKRDIVAFHVFVLGLISTIFLTIVFAFGLVFLSDYVFDLFNSKELKEWWWLIVIASLVISVFEALTMWSVRLKSYKLISSVQVRQSFLGELTKLAVGLAGFKPLGLILGHFLGQSFGVKLYVRESYSFFRSGVRRLTARRFLFLAKYYSSFVFYRLPSDLLLILSVQAPVIMATKLYDTGTAGQLALTFMALALPISLVGAAVSRVYYAEISSIGRYNRGKIRLITIKVQKKLFFLAFPGALLVYFFSEKLFIFVFGDKWVAAGLYASMLAPYLLLQFTSSPLMQLINVLGKQAIFLILNGGRVLGLVLLYCLASIYQFAPEVFVARLSLLLFLYYLFQSIVIFSLLRK